MLVDTLKEQHTSAIFRMRLFLKESSVIKSLGMLDKDLSAKAWIFMNTKGARRPSSKTKMPPGKTFFT